MAAGSILLVAAAAGLVTHNVFFKHGEHHLDSPWLFRLSVAALASLPSLGLMHGSSYSRDGFLVLASFVLALFLSITSYRLLFHPLHSFNGPLLNRASKLWHVWKILDSQGFLYLDQLHKQYGEFVRTGLLFDVPR